MYFNMNLLSDFLGSDSLAFKMLRHESAGVRANIGVN